MTGWTEIGRVRSLNPQRREVRIKPVTAHEQAFQSAEWLYFAQLGKTEPLRCRVKALSLGKDKVVAVLAPGVPRDTVAELRGATVVVPSETAAPRRIEWSIRGLVGMDVREEDGTPLGVVTEVYEGPANDAFCVARPGGGRITLPAIDLVITDVDLDAGEITVADITPYAVEQP